MEKDPAPSFDRLSQSGPPHPGGLQEAGQATEEEIRAAALQYVRKISGYRKPSRANAEAFERAVVEVAKASRELLEAVG